MSILKRRFMTPNVQAQGRCAALSRSVPWSAVLGIGVFGTRLGKLVCSCQSTTNSDNAAADSDRHGPCRRSAYANERKSWASPPANCSTGGCEWNSCRHANAPSCKTNT